MTDSKETSSDDSMIFEMETENQASPISSNQTKTKSNNDNSQNSHPLSFLNRDFG